MRTKKNEIMIAPDKDYLIAVIYKKTTWSPFLPFRDILASNKAKIWYGVQLSPINNLSNTTSARLLICTVLSYPDLYQSVF